MKDKEGVLGERKGEGGRKIERGNKEGERGQKSGKGGREGLRGQSGRLSHTTFFSTAFTFV